MKHKIYFLPLLILTLVFITSPLYSQKDTRETMSTFAYIIPNNGPQGSDSKQYDREKINTIVAEIRNARQNGDFLKSEKLQKELEKITGNISQDNSVFINNGPLPIIEYVNQPLGQSDYNLTIISPTDAAWAVATSTDPISGRIYVVQTKYVNAASDTAKVYTSTNHGMSWTLIYRVFYAVDMDFRNDELDIEAINNGTTSYIYVVAGFTSSSVHYSTIYRMNSSGGETFFANFYSAVPGNAFLNPRITSDNGKYTNLTYVYIILTQDSTTGSTHHLKTKFSIITNPYAATPTITNRNFTPQNSYWWQLPNAGDTTILFNDIVYSDSASTDWLITVSNFYRAGINNLYFTYSNDYGATSPSRNPFLTETNVNYMPRLASSRNDDTIGGQYIMLAYTRQFSSTDWDPYYRITTNNGTSWSSGYISGALDTTIYTDVEGIPGIRNKFRFAYAVRNSPTSSSIYLRQYNNGSMPTAFVLSTNMGFSFTPVRAGYRYSTDSCFTLGHGVGGVGVYAYMGCSGSLVNIGKNEIPVEFKLSQNYPNPFNPTTKISFTIPTSAFVSLKVYDILGKEVATLINEKMNAGNYIYEFNAENLTSGIYFYKLESNNFSAIRKMVLLK
ncbi:MAG: T9SS type A sorting domain-containing protein [Ignavibacteria bacterium]|nr:T9SS type A sorting domain-containing protein [Ignavibacteria bacterium]